MFVLCKDMNASRGEQYQIFAGTKYNVNKKVPARDSSKSTNSKLVELLTELEIVNLLKGTEAVKKAFINLKKKDTPENLTNFKRVFLNKLLSLHSCIPDHFQVCRECGKMMDTQEDEVIGTISLKPIEIEKLLNVEQNWACNGCRIEFALVTWLKRDGKTYDSQILHGKTQEIKDKTNQLLQGNFTCVRTVVRVSPSVDDYKIVAHIIKKLNAMTSNKEDEIKYKNLIIKSFIEYHTQQDQYVSRICERCGHFWKNRKDLGYSSMDTYEICKIIGNKNWVCTKCSSFPLLELQTYEDRDRSFSYGITINGQISRKALEKKPEKYERKYVCLELYGKLNYKRMLHDIYIRGIVHELGEKLRSPLSEFELIKTIVKTFIFEININEAKICKYCHHIFDERGKEHGYFWAYCDLSMLFTEYVCSFHEVKNIMFWNMTGWKTVEKVRGSQMKFLEDTDIIFLIETHLVDGMNIDTQNYFSDRIIVNVAAEKRASQGRGSGGLMFLIKSNIICKQTKIEYSNKGVFQKIQFPNEVFIVGGIYWRPEPNNGETLDDWIKELDNFFLVNKSSEIKFIIGGDFNGRVKGDDSVKESQLFKGSTLSNTRKSADQVWNKRGRLLVGLMKKHHMVLCNGRTKSDKKGEFTSRTVNGESVVDYVWVSKNVVPMVKDMVVKDIYSDSSDYHRALHLQLT